MLNNIEYLVLDLDGTLLNNNRNVSENTIMKLEELLYKIDVIINTSRPIHAVLQLLPKRIHNVWKICDNGASIYSPNNECIYKEFLNPVWILNFIKYINNINYSHLSWVENSVWSSCSRIFDEDILKMYGVKNDDSLFIRTIESINVNKISKILLTNSDFTNNEVNVCKVERNKLTIITKKGINKTSGLLYLMNKWNKDYENFLIFGDDHNDLSLFQKFPYSVAMGNSIQALKDICFKITDDNDNEGVYKILDYYFKK